MLPLLSPDAVRPPGRPSPPIRRRCPGTQAARALSGDAVEGVARRGAGQAAPGGPLSAAHGAQGSAGARPWRKGVPPRARRRGRTSPGAARAGRGHAWGGAGCQGAGKEGGGGANPCTTRAPAGGSGEEGRGPGPRPLLSTGGRRRSREAITPRSDLPGSAEGGGSREEWTSGGTGSTGPRACGTGAGPSEGGPARPPAGTPAARLRRGRSHRRALQAVRRCGGRRRAPWRRASRHEPGGGGERRPGLPGRDAVMAGGPQVARGPGRRGEEEQTHARRAPPRGDRVRKAEGRGPGLSSRPAGGDGREGRSPHPRSDLPGSAEGGSSREEWTSGGTGSTGPALAGRAPARDGGGPARPPAWTPAARLRRGRPARMASQEARPC